MEDFEILVAEGFDNLPDKYKKLVKNVAIVIEEGSPGGKLLGLYVGVPQTARTHAYGFGGTLPDKITIYKQPIEFLARGEPARISEIVRDTVWHEIAHHFGFDEPEVRRREGLRGKNNKKR